MLSEDLLKRQGVYGDVREKVGCRTRSENVIFSLLL